MISPKAFYDTLAAQGVSFLTGVPDSLLKEFCSYVDAVLPPEKHIIAANEGCAVGIAAGYHLASGKIPLVYLQNSGLGNIVNPLLSLSDPEVYGLPVIVLVGWRGAPGEKDEPQHVKQGRVTEAMLEAMEIPFRVLAGQEDEAMDCANWAVREAAARSGPVVLLARKGAFGPEEAKRQDDGTPYNVMDREQAIAAIIESIGPDATIIATTGMISRELYEQRMRRDEDCSSDFLTVGSMGHASQIALGIANTQPERNVICLDGDGAVLMHMGGMATIGALGKGNILHIVLNNGAHGSVGGQPTVGFDVALTGIAKACGYQDVVGPLQSEADVRVAVAELIPKSGRRFLEVCVGKMSRGDLGRPKRTPKENKALFVSRLQQTV